MSPDARSLLRALFWLGIYLGLILAPVVLLLFLPVPPGGGFWWDLAVALGFVGMVMMAIQFLLTARFQRATAPFGIDLIYYLHRYLAYALLAIVLAHPIILLILNPALRGYLNPLEAPWEMTAGTASVLLLLLLVLLSVGRKQLKIPYEVWRVTHFMFAVAAMGLAFAHMAVAGSYFRIPPVQLLWMVIGLSLLVVVLKVRLFRPWRLTGHPFQVTDVRSEPGRAWRLSVSPVGHPGFSFLPGQFAWLTFRASPFAMKEHPFSIASAPRSDGQLEFAIKELGDFTSTIGRVAVGEVVYVDGPYGSFSIDRHPEAAGYVFLAGGIGVAPMVSMLRALAERGDRRPHILFSAHAREESIPLGAEISALRNRLSLKVVQLLEEPPENWTGETGWIREELLDRHLPEDRSEFEYFICGPVPMIRAAEAALRAARVPASRVHSELFDLV